MRIVIVDDRDDLRAQLRQVIQTQTTFEVVGEASNGAVALTIVDTLEPDVVIMGVALPGMDGIEATSRIKARHPRIHVLALTGNRRAGEQMQAAGASGYLDGSEKLRYHLEPLAP